MNNENSHTGTMLCKRRKRERVGRVGGRRRLEMAPVKWLLGLGRLRVTTLETDAEKPKQVVVRSEYGKERGRGGQYGSVSRLGMVSP